MAARSSDSSHVERSVSTAGIDQPQSLFDRYAQTRVEN
jgi:hypothetical protein